MEILNEGQLSVEDWEPALGGFGEGAEVLQSPVWKEISEAEGSKVLGIAWREEGKIAVLAQVLESRKAGFTSWYIPRGPLCLNGGMLSSWKVVWTDLLSAAKKAGAISLVFEPEGWDDSIDFGEEIKPIQPKRTIMLDLSLSDDDLLAAMHHKTRYNIRLAAKRGVVVGQGSLEDLPIFTDLLNKTTERDGFRAHSSVHYRRLIEQGHGSIQLWLAKLEGKVLAAGIFSFYKGRAVYMHGASANEGREHMAPYLLQWEMIRKAKAEGCKRYDFYGIDEARWPGVTRFKRGFGGIERLYPGTFRVVIKPGKQFIYNILAHINRLVRKLL